MIKANSGLRSGARGTLTPSALTSLLLSSVNDLVSSEYDTNLKRVSAACSKQTHVSECHKQVSCVVEFQTLGIILICSAVQFKKYRFCNTVKATLGVSSLWNCDTNVIFQCQGHPWLDHPIVETDFL